MKPAAAKPAKAAAPADVARGDHVYYRHPEHGLLAGEVISRPGMDGFRVRNEKHGVHGVTWDSLVGHKLRQRRNFRVVDRGEDGSLCVDDNGRTVFIRNGAQAGPEILGKALVDALVPLPPPPVPAIVDSQVLALEVGRAQLETATMLTAAMDRMTQAVLAQTARLDQLIALQVAALNQLPEGDAK